MISQFFADGLGSSTCACVCVRHRSRKMTATRLIKATQDASRAKRRWHFLSFFFSFFFLKSNQEEHLLIQLYWDFLLTAPHRTAFLPSTSEPRCCLHRLPQFGELFIPLLKWSRSFSPLHASWIISEYVLSSTTNFSLLEKKKRKRHKHFSLFHLSRWTPSPTKKPLNLSIGTDSGQRSKVSQAQIVKHTACTYRA